MNEKPEVQRLEEFEQYKKDLLEVLQARDPSEPLWDRAVEETATYLNENGYTKDEFIGWYVSDPYFIYDVIKWTLDKNCRDKD